MFLTLSLGSLIGLSREVMKVDLTRSAMNKLKPTFSLPTNPNDS
jgi:hypothetical protein